MQMMSKGLDTSSKTISLEGGKTWTTQQGREGISRPTICCRSPLAFTVVATAGIQLEASMPEGDRWIVFAGICKALGYKNPNHESKKVDPEEKRKLDIGLKNTLAVCINRRGLLRFFAVRQQARRR